MTPQALVPMFVPGGFGPMEFAIIFMIAVLLFGANKIPKLARSTGQAMGEFQRGRSEIEKELENMQEPPETGDEDEESSPVEAEDTDETK